MTAPLVPARAALAAVPLHLPPKGEVAIDLSDNTSRWGPSPAAARVVAAEQTASLSRYPEPYSDALKSAIAGYLGTEPDRVVTGCGSDDVLDCAIRAFCEPGDRVAIQDPTFPMIARFARLNGLEPVPVPLESNYDLDVEAMLARDAGVIYVCSPNNPTGTRVSRERIEALSDATRGVVIVDEAYAEFTSDNVADLARKRPNVLVTRTMSKAFGLAGLRVGYGVADPALILQVEKSRGPYKVGSLAARAAAAALTEDVHWVRGNAQGVVALRERLAASLRARGLNPIPSEANFVLVPIADATGVARRMHELGVAVRPLEGLAPISDALRATGGSALRISVGPRAELETAIATLDRARGAV